MVSSVITSLDDLERLLQLARRNGVTHLEFGEIKAVLSPPEAPPPKEQFTHTENPLDRLDLNAEAFNTYKNL